MIVMAILFYSDGNHRYLAPTEELLKIIQMEITIKAVYIELMAIEVIDLVSRLAWNYMDFVC